MFKIKRSSLFLIIILMFVSMILFACSNDNKKEEQTGKNAEAENEEVIPEIDMSEEITLKMNDWRGEEQFTREFKDPIEAEFPNVTIELIPIMPTKELLEESFADGIVPDILLAPDFRYLPVYKDADLAYDITEFTEKYDLDIDRFDSNFLDIMRSYSEEGELWGLPYIQGKAALHYNKDIFDLFGVEYPTDDMTYKELRELAAKVTGERGGTYYTGMAMPSADRYLFPSLSLTLLDPETDEPLFTKEPAIQEVFETYQSVNDLQEEGNAFHGDHSMNQFLSEQTLAMIPMYFIGLDWTGVFDSGVNWDIVTFPKWEEQEDVAAFADGYWVGISSYSDYKPQVYKIIEFIMSDEEILRKIRYPEESVYLDDAFFDLAEETRNPLLKDKNLEALYKYPAPNAPEGRSKYEEIAIQVVDDKLGEYLTSSMDVNTFLRELEEETIIRVTEAKADEVE